MNTSHTPGPWTIHEGGVSPIYNGLVCIVDDHLSVIAEGKLVASDAWMDNARLIAAAPDMLAALKAAEYAIRSNCGRPTETYLAVNAPRLEEIMRLAIAKATGGRS